MIPSIVITTESVNVGSATEVAFTVTVPALIGVTLPFLSTVASPVSFVAPVSQVTFLLEKSVGTKWAVTVVVSLTAICVFLAVT